MEAPLQKGSQAASLRLIYLPTRAWQQPILDAVNRPHLTLMSLQINEIQSLPPSAPCSVWFCGTDEGAAQSV